MNVSVILSSEIDLLTGQSSYQLIISSNGRRILQIPVPREVVTELTGQVSQQTAPSIQQTQPIEQKIPSQAPKTLGQLLGIEDEPPPATFDPNTL